MPPSARRPSTAAIVFAFLALYVVWGSTYLGIAIAIETMPPFLMATARFLVAGGILYAIMRLRGEPAPDRTQLRSATIVGTLLFVGGNGLVSWAERWVPSGTAALIVATTPMWMTVIPWSMGKSAAPRPMQAAGLAIGLGGVALLLMSAPAASATSGAAVIERAHVVVGSMVVLVSALCWSIGSLSSKGLPLPESPWMSSALQMICGGIALLMLSIVTGEPAGFEPSQVSLRSLLALVYLVVIGAIVGFCAFMFLLRWVAPAKVATYAFVNPAVAVLLGWAMKDEQVTPMMLGAGALIVIAVAAIILSKPRSEPTLTAAQVQQIRR